MKYILLSLILLQGQDDPAGRLIQQLSDDSIEIRTRAERELRRLGAKAETPLRNALPKTEGETRETVLRLLARIEFDGLLPPWVIEHRADVLIHLLSESEETRMTGLRELDSVASYQCDDIVRRFLKDPSEKVRRLAVHCRTSHALPEAAELYMAELEHTSEDHWKRCQARRDTSGMADAVSEIGKDFAPRVLKLLESPDPCQRRDAISIVRTWRLNDAVPSLLKLLKDELGIIRAEAARTLSDLKAEAARGDFEKAVRGDDLPLAFIAAQGLARLGNADLSKSLSDARICLLSTLDRGGDTDMLREAALLLLKQGSADHVAIVFLHSRLRGDLETERREAIQRVGVQTLFETAIRKRKELSQAGMEADSWYLKYHLRHSYLETEMERAALAIVSKKGGAPEEREFALQYLSSYSSPLPPREMDEACASMKSILESPSSPPSEVDAAAEILAARKRRDAADAVAAAFRRRPDYALASSWMDLSDGKAVAPILEAIKAEKLQTSEYLLLLLGRSDRDEAADFLIDVLKNAPQFTPYCVRALSSSPSTQARRAAREYLRTTESSDNAYQAINALAHSEDPEAVPLVRLWMDRLPATTMTALSWLGDREFADEWLKVAKAPNPEKSVLQAAEEALVRLGDRRVLELLRPQLLSTDRSERGRAARLVGELRDCESAGLLTRLIPWESYYYSLGALVRIAPDSARGLGLKLYQSRKSDRVEILYALVPCLGPQDTEMLYPLVEDKDLAGAAARGMAAASEGRGSGLAACLHRQNVEPGGLPRLLEKAFGGKFAVSPAAERSGATTDFDGTYTRGEALNLIPASLSWLTGPEGTLIVTSEEAVSHWKAFRAAHGQDPRK